MSDLGQRLSAGLGGVAGAGGGYAGAYVPVPDILRELEKVCTVLEVHSWEGSSHRMDPPMYVYA